jgi:hypothetical protein
MIMRLAVLALALVLMAAPVPAAAMSIADLPLIGWLFGGSDHDGGGAYLRTDYGDPNDPNEAQLPDPPSDDGDGETPINPVPEPSAIALFGAGALAVGAAIRRQAKRNR